MTASVRVRYFLSFLMLASFVVLTVGLYLEDVLGNWFEAQVAAELRRHALTGRSLAENQPPAKAGIPWDALANHFDHDRTFQVTFIDADGTVLGDSQHDAEALRTMPNHATKPEIVAAIERGLGQNHRYSTTAGVHRLYVAVPFRHPTWGTGVVRVAVTMDAVQAVKNRLHQALFVAGCLASLLAVALSDVSSQWATRSLRYVIARAQNMAASTSLPKIDIPLHDEIAGLVGSLNLLAEAKNNTLAQLAEQQSKMAAVLQSMSEGVIALDGNHRITLMNRLVLELLRLPHPLIGKPLRMALPAAAVDELGGEAYPSKTFSTEFDLDGPSPRRVTAVMTPLHKHQGYVIVLHDVTEIRRLDRVRRDFVANVSHELRTPVSVLQANAQTLLGGALKDKKYSRVLAEAMERNANRLARLISDLLDLSRLEAGRALVPLKSLAPLPLSPLVQETVDLMFVAAREKQATVENRIPPHCVVQVDEEALRRILINFLDNALNYTPPKTHIIIRWNTEAKQARMEVEDNGPGVEAHHRDRLFERFYRGNTGRTRRVGDAGGGTGLGLSIVKHLAENMKETVGMEPVDPHGSRFWVTLTTAVEDHGGGPRGSSP